MKNELIEVKLQVESQQSALKISDNYLQKFKSLASEGFVSQTMVQEKEQANLDARTKLHSLIRDQSNSDRDLHDTQVALEDFNDKSENERNALNREISTLQQDIVETEMRREVIIYSRTNGTATAVLPEVGQSVTTPQMLASIIPENLNMYIQLNVPTAAAGLIAPGQQVLVRYTSFPYERFGQFKGIILSVPQTAMSSSELKINDETKDLFYAARTKINSQEVSIGGQHFPLREGMQVEADILLESRHLAEWLIEPALKIKQRYGNDS